MTQMWNVNLRYPRATDSQIISSTILTKAYGRPLFISDIEEADSQITKQTYIISNQHLKNLSI